MPKYSWTESIEIQKEEFKSLWAKVRESYEDFAAGGEEDLEGDRGHVSFLDIVGWGT